MKPKKSAQTDRIPLKWTDALRADAERLNEFVNFSMGDPLLNPWEAEFIHSIQRYLVSPSGEPRMSAFQISEKQQVIVDGISAKLGFRCEPEPVAVIEEPGEYIDPALLPDAELTQSQHHPLCWQDFV